MENRTQCAVFCCAVFRLKGSITKQQILCKCKIGIT